MIEGTTTITLFERRTLMRALGGMEVETQKLRQGSESQTKSSTRPKKAETALKEKPTTDNEKEGDSDEKTDKRGLKKSAGRKRKIENVRTKSQNSVSENAEKIDKKSKSKVATKATGKKSAGRKKAEELAIVGINVEDNSAACKKNPGRKKKIVGKFDDVKKGEDATDQRKNSKDNEVKNVKRIESKTLNKQAAATNKAKATGEKKMGARKDARAQKEGLSKPATVSKRKSKNEQDVEPASSQTRPKRLRVKRENSDAFDPDIQRAIARSLACLNKETKARGKKVSNEAKPRKTTEGKNKEFVPDSKNPASRGKKRKVREDTEANESTAEDEARRVSSGTAELGRLGIQKMSFKKRKISGSFVKLEEFAVEAQEKKKYISKNRERVERTDKDRERVERTSNGAGEIASVKNEVSKDESTRTSAKEFDSVKNEISSVKRDRGNSMNHNVHAGDDSSDYVPGEDEGDYVLDEDASSSCRESPKTHPSVSVSPKHRSNSSTPQDSASPSFSAFPSDASPVDSNDSVRHQPTSHQTTQASECDRAHHSPYMLPSASQSSTGGIYKSLPNRQLNRNEISQSMATLPASAYLPAINQAASYISAPQLSRPHELQPDISSPYHPPRIGYPTPSQHPQQPASSPVKKAYEGPHLYSQLPANADHLTQRSRPLSSSEDYSRSSSSSRSRPRDNHRFSNLSNPSPHTLSHPEKNYSKGHSSSMDSARSSRKSSNSPPYSPPPNYTSRYSPSRDGSRRGRSEHRASNAYSPSFNHARRERSSPGNRLQRNGSYGSHNPEKYSDTRPHSRNEEKSKWGGNSGPIHKDDGFKSAKNSPANRECSEAERCGYDNGQLYRERADRRSTSDKQRADIKFGRSKEERAREYTSNGYKMQDMRRGDNSVKRGSRSGRHEIGLLNNGSRKPECAVPVSRFGVQTNPPTAEPNRSYSDYRNPGSRGGQSQR